LLKNKLFIGLFFVFIFSFITGCVNNAQFGAPEPEKGFTGVVISPGSCFFDGTTNQAITSGNTLLNVQVYFYSGQSGTFEASTTASPYGVFEIDNPVSSAYIIYAFREYPQGSGQFVVLKKAVINLSPSERINIGEINSYTTAQVIIWEQANLLYSNNFTLFDPQNSSWSFNPSDLILSVEDIPNLVPTTKLIDAVDKALLECRDPQKDSNVIKYAKEIVRAQFGAPDIEPISVPIVVTPTPCVAPLPDVKFTKTVNGLDVTFINLTTGAISYLWNYGDGNTSYIMDQQHTHHYSTAGSYLVSLTAFNVCGQSVTMASIPVQVINTENIIISSNE